MSTRRRKNRSLFGKPHFSPTLRIILLPPADLEKKYRDLGAGGQAKYYAMCEWFDQSCRKLLDDLDNLKLSDNTLVVYACDNGWGRLDGKKGSVKASPY